MGQLQEMLDKDRCLDTGAAVSVLESKNGRQRIVMREPYYTVRYASKPSDGWQKDPLI